MIAHTVYECNTYQQTTNRKIEWNGTTYNITLKGSLLITVSNSIRIG